MNTEPRKNEVTAFFAAMKDKLPGRVLAFVLRNWPWKLLALFLAVCLWAGLIMQDPTLTRERLFTDAPLNVVNAETLRRKLQMGAALGFSAAFFMWPEVKDIAGALFG